MTIPNTETGISGSYKDTYTYDLADHVTSDDMPGLSTGTGSLPEEVVTSAYNRGYATTVIGTGNYITATGYGSEGLLLSRGYGGTVGTPAITDQYTYDASTQRLQTANVLTPSFTSLSNDQYAYDDAGNVTQKTDVTDAQAQCYIYDAQFRLARALTTASTSTCATTIPAYSATGPGPYDVSYGYDSLGNLAQTVNNVNSNLTTYTYGGTAPDQVTSIGSTAFTYDGNGAVHTLGATTLGWDRQRRLSTVLNGQGTTTNVYDATGNRIIVTSPTTKTLFLPTGELAVTIATGAKTATRYYSEAGTTVATRTPSSLSWIVQDNQGSDSISIDSGSLAVSRKFYTLGGSPFFGPFLLS